LSAIAGTIKGPYATYTWLIVCGLRLIFVIALLYCLAVYIEQDSDFDWDETDNEAVVSDISVSEITVTATPDYK